MCIKKDLFHSAGIALTGVVIALMTLSITFKVYAQESPPLPENGTCASCHEDLYFLHDTGNWFCIRESPMQCVDCHGGDPYTFNQADAHANRQPHPILNEDISKCQECHPDECTERVAKFDQTAGISDVLVAAPLQIQPSLAVEEFPAAPVVKPAAHPAWISFLEIIVLALLAGLALAVHFVRKAQQTQK
jgi:hypothetical protein